MRSLLLFSLVCLFWAQSFAQSDKVAIRGGTIHVGHGKVIENGLICFENGTFTLVQSVATIKTDETLGKIIDATGKHIYAGLITKAGSCKSKAHPSAIDGLFVNWPAMYNNKKHLRFDTKTATIAQGQNATLIISSGDILEMKIAHVEKAFVDGREIDLNKKHK